MSSVKNLSNKLSSLNKEDTYSMMLMLLYASNDNPRYSTLSELAYVLDHENFLNFIKYYEGQTIEIPSMDVIEDSLRVLMLFQYYKRENMDWTEAIHKAGFSSSESMSAKHKLDRFLANLDRYDYRLGGLLKNDR